LGRGKTATDEAVRRCLEEKIDVLLVQEPYTTNRRMKVSGCRVYHDRSGREDIWSAVLVMNEKIGAIMQAAETNGSCVSVRLEIDGRALQVISLYCRPSEGIDAHLSRLEDIIRKKGNKGLLCGADLNARSGLWLSGSTDERGAKVEDVVMAWDLQVLNRFSRWTTYENTQGGKSNIDVTLATRDVAQGAEEWRVHEETVSDHRLISVKLRERLGEIGLRNEQRVGSYCLRKVNWRNFDQALQRNVQNIEVENLTAQEQADWVTEMTCRLMEEQFPKAKKGTRKVYWWSTELDEMRVAMRRRHRIWHRTGRDEDRQRFVRARNDYIWEIRKQKRISWEKLIAEEEGDPWGKVYKIVTEKTKRETLLVSLEKEDGAMTETVEDTLRTMIQGLLPDDREEEDTEDQKFVRERMLEDSTGLNEVEFTEMELTASVKELKDRKAPGYEGIKGEVVKRMFGRIKGVLLSLYNKMLREGVFPDVWKKGIVKVFLKSEDKDPSKVKSYRPVTLLPVLGKLGERLMVRRMKQWMEREGRVNRAQYGFTEGVGTLDALLDMRSEVEIGGKICHRTVLGHLRSF